MRQPWEAAVERDTASFRSQLTQLLSEPPSAPRTDLAEAIRRADIFLAEPEPSGQPHAHRFLICATDGRDNVHAAPITMTSGAQFIIVNASGSLGSLDPLRPVRFESLAAAIEFVYTSEVREKEDN